MEHTRSRFSANVENQSLLRAYRSERKIHFAITIDTGRAIVAQESAQSAIRTARINLDWAAHEWNEFDEPEIGSVRLRFAPDESPDHSWLEQDCYSDRYRADMRDTIDRDGVWGCIGEYFDGEDWQAADSVWGFVGQDAHGYTPDIKAETLQAAHGAI